MVWIIMKLKKLAVPLEYSMFPSFLKFLEPGPQNFLEKAAQLTMEIKELNKKIKREGRMGSNGRAIADLPTSDIGGLDDVHSFLQ